MVSGAIARSAESSGPVVARVQAQPERRGVAGGDRNRGRHGERPGQSGRFRSRCGTPRRLVEDQDVRPLVLDGLLEVGHLVLGAGAELAQALEQGTEPGAGGPILRLEGGQVAAERRGGQSRGAQHGEVVGAGADRDPVAARAALREGIHHRVEPAGAGSTWPRTGIIVASCARGRTALSCRPRRRPVRSAGRAHASSGSPVGWSVDRVRGVEVDVVDPRDAGVCSPHSPSTVVVTACPQPCA